MPFGGLKILSTYTAIPATTISEALLEGHIEYDLCMYPL
jgi:hypothetical protein